MEIVVALLILVGLSALFIVSYVFNKRTPKPPGCEEEDIEECTGCKNVLCARNPEKSKKEIE